MDDYIDATPFYEAQNKVAEALAAFLKSVDELRAAWDALKPNARCD